MEKILVIEDEVQIARVLKTELEFEGYEVYVEYGGKSGLDTALENKFNCILLDVMLPELNGFEVLRKLRKENNDTPIIMLTARNTTFDKVSGLDKGANDYVTKPFETEELLARIRVCIRDYSKGPKGNQNNSILKVDDLLIDTDLREVKRNGQMINLTPKEYDFLVYLITNKNKVVTRESIISNVWGYDYIGETNVIDVFIRHLRKKVDENFSTPLITTVRGIGFMIREQKDENNNEN